MPGNHEEQPPDSSDPAANAFYDELTRSLQSEPITENMDIHHPPEKPKAPSMYTLRRQWIPQPGDALGSSSLLELVMKYKQHVAVNNNLGLTLLPRLTAEVIAKHKRSPDPTKEVMEALAKELPSELHLFAASVAILGKPEHLPGKRYVGFRFTDESDQLVQQDEDSILHGLVFKTTDLPRRDLAHLSLFTTEYPAVATELAAELQSIVTFPNELLFGIAKTARFRQTV
jgi:hypothetical protein